MENKLVNYTSKVVTMHTKEGLPAETLWPVSEMVHTIKEITAKGQSVGLGLVTNDTELGPHKGTDKPSRKQDPVTKNSGCDSPLSSSPIQPAFGGRDHTTTSQPHQYTAPTQQNTQLSILFVMEERRRLELRHQEAYAREAIERTHMELAHCNMDQLLTEVQDLVNNINIGSAKQHSAQHPLPSPSPADITSSPDASISSPRPFEPTPPTSPIYPSYPTKSRHHHDVFSKPYHSPLDTHYSSSSSQQPVTTPTLNLPHVSSSGARDTPTSYLSSVQQPHASQSAPPLSFMVDKEPPSYKSRLATIDDLLMLITVESNDRLKICQRESIERTKLSGHCSTNLRYILLHPQPQNTAYSHKKPRDSEKPKMTYPSPRSGDWAGPSSLSHALSVLASNKDKDTLKATVESFLSSATVPPVHQTPSQNTGTSPPKEDGNYTAQGEASKEPSSQRSNYSPHYGSSVSKTRKRDPNIPPADLSSSSDETDSNGHHVPSTREVAHNTALFQFCVVTMLDAEQELRLSITSTESRDRIRLLYMFNRNNNFEDGGYLVNKKVVKKFYLPDSTAMDPIVLQTKDPHVDILKLEIASLQDRQHDLKQAVSEMEYQLQMSTNKAIAEETLNTDLRNKNSVVMIQYRLQQEEHANQNIAQLVKTEARERALLRGYCLEDRDSILELYEYNKYRLQHQHFQYQKTQLFDAEKVQRVEIHDQEKAHYAELCNGVSKLNQSAVKLHAISQQMNLVLQEELHQRETLQQSYNDTWLSTVDLLSDALECGNHLVNKWSRRCRGILDSCADSIQSTECWNRTAIMKEASQNIFFLEIHKYAARQTIVYRLQLKDWEQKWINSQHDYESLKTMMRIVTDDIMDKTAKLCKDIRLSIMNEEAVERNEIANALNYNLMLTKYQTCHDFALLELTHMIGCHQITLNEHDNLLRMMHMMQVERKNIIESDAKAKAIHTALKEVVKHEAYDRDTITSLYFTGISDLYASQKITINCLLHNVIIQEYVNRDCLKWAQKQLQPFKKQYMIQLYNMMDKFYYISHIFFRCEEHERRSIMEWEQNGRQHIVTYGGWQALYLPSPQFGYQRSPTIPQHYADDASPQSHSSRSPSPPPRAIRSPPKRVRIRSSPSELTRLYDSYRSPSPPSNNWHSVSPLSNYQTTQTAASPSRRKPPDDIVAMLQNSQGHRHHLRKPSPPPAAIRRTLVPEYYSDNEYAPVPRRTTPQKRPGDNFIAVSPLLADTDDSLIVTSSYNPDCPNCHSIVHHNKYHPPAGIVSPGRKQRRQTPQHVSHRH